MILAIDIGNTNISIGCIRNDEILFIERLSTDTSKTGLEYAISFKNVLEIYHLSAEEIEGTILASVVPPLTNTIKEAAKKISHSEVMVVGPGVKTGINIMVDQPSQTGADLIANAAAGIQEYPLPLIIISMGTATTLSVIDEKKRYIGGMILPGVKVSSEALTRSTSQLPKISLEPPKKVIGTNTVDCMKSGLLYGSAACIDGIIEKAEEALGQKTTVVATGSLANDIIPLCKRDIIIDEKLRIKGLLSIYKRNIEK